MKREAVALAAAAIAATPAIAQAHELTPSQKRVYKHRWQLSAYKVRWYHGRGRWTTRPRHRRCRELRFPKPRGRCYLHRANLRWHEARVARIGRLLWPPRPAYLGPRAAICAVFGPYCSQALAVADCETGGTFSTSARNGQYLGLFQMGERERATYGNAWDALGQARAAYRYFVASGRDWSPWECRP